MIKFKHIAFIGKECIVDVEFEPLLNEMGDIAFLYGLKIFVTSSFRKDMNVKGAIVTPAKMSNHMVGHAIDCNILDENNKLWNSKMLENPSKKIAEFIDKCKVVGLRWGGDFAKKDTVHFDDALNYRNPKLWKDKYRLLHL